MKKIYLDNIQIHDNQSDIGFIVSPNIKGLESPIFRLPGFNRPNTDGAFVPNHLYGGRVITLTGMVYASNVSTYRLRRRQLEQASQIKKVSGEVNPITMKFTTMDDLQLQVNVYTRKLTFTDRYLTHGKFKLDFFAPSLYIESQTLYATDIFIFSGGGMGIPMGIPMDMSTDGDAYAVLNNLGNIEAYPVIKFYGPIQDPTLTNETNGDSLSLTYTLSSNQRIEIDTVNRTALYFSSPTAQGTNVRQYVSGDWLKLEPGSNNLKLVVAVYNSSGYAHVEWRDTYSGI